VVTLVRRLILVIGGLLVTLGYFLVLPLLGSLGHQPEDQLELRRVEVTEEPPPPPPQVEEEREEEEEREPEPELEEQAEPLDLSQLELALSAGTGGDWQAGFAVDLEKHIQQAAGADAVFSMAELDQPPRAVFRAAPQYPPDLQRQGVGGTVIVAFMVSPDGRVERPRVQESPHPELGRAALRAIEKWKFDPGRRKGKPVHFSMRVPITFAPE
jgi:protein TonB